MKLMMSNRRKVEIKQKLKFIGVVEDKSKESAMAKRLKEK